MIRTAVFQKDTISAINGGLVISPDSALLTTDVTGDDDEFFYIDSTSIVAGSILRIKDGSDDEWMKVLEYGAGTVSVGFNHGSSAIDDSSVGTLTWSNPTNALSSNNAYATCGRGPLGSVTYSHYLKATNFGFSIPFNATIEGIIVRIEKKGSHQNTGVADYVVKLIKSDSSLGTENKAKTGSWQYTADTNYDYGSASDLWSDLWTASDINSSNFGLAISCGIGPSGLATTAYIDDISITVYYSLPSGAYSVTRDFKGDYASNSNPTWKKGATIINYGLSGEGFIDMNASETNSPFIHIATHSGMPWSDADTKVLIGQLFSKTGVDEFGIWVKSGAAYIAGHRLYDAVVASDGLGDFDNLQDAINSLPSGGTIFVRTGTYIITSTIQIDYSNISIVGEDKNKTILYLDDNIGDPIMSLSAVSNVKISNITFNGNKANNTASDGLFIEDSGYIVISDCLFIDNYSNGILIEGGSDLKITESVFNSSGEFGIKISYAGLTDKGKSIITNNSFIDCGDTGYGGVEIHGRCFGIIIDSNIFENCYRGIVVDGNVYYCLEHIITNNIIKSSTSYGIYLFDNMGQIQGCLINNNNIRNGSDYAIRISSAYGQNTVNNNIIYNNINGIYIQSSDSNTIQGNNIYLFDDYGINLSGGNYNAIGGNIIEGYSSTACIYFNTSTDNIVDGNVIRAASSTYGIRESSTASNRNIFSNNRITGASTANLSIQGASSINDNNITT